MKTILITAYAINPFKGSEDGTGWNITREILQEFKVILITRENNVPHLEKWFKDNDADLLDRIHFVGFDLPSSVLKIKKKMGSKGHVIYFYLWQRYIARFIKKQAFKFDLAMSLNFHSDSHPHFLWKFNTPIFWGPIGHHPRIPREFVLKYGVKAYMIDRMFFGMKWMMRKLNPAYRKAVRRTEKIFVINSSIQGAIGAGAPKVIHLPAVAAPESMSSEKASGEKFTVLCAGRFHFMKGFDIALRAFAEFTKNLCEKERENVELILVGKGDEKDRLQAMIDDSEIASRIKWLDWVPHSEMKALYQSSQLFLFPSHEGAGMVVPEAMSYGLPVLTFANYGPGELIGIDELQVPYGPYQESVHSFAEKLETFYHHRDLLNQLGEKAQLRQRTHLTWKVKGEIIRDEITRTLNITFNENNRSIPSIQ